MKIEGTGLLVRIYIGETDTWHGRPLYEAIVHFLRERGIAGATVLRGIEGFGAKQHLHSARILSLSTDLPVLIEIVDQEDRLRAVLPELDAMVGDGLITSSEALPTNVPKPCRISTMPSACSARTASRTLLRLAPSRSMSCGSVGMGAPGTGSSATSPGGWCGSGSSGPAS